MNRASHTDSTRLSKALGWSSIGLGAVEFLAPRQLSEYFGVEDHAGLVRAFGAREIVADIGILSPM